jgi:hypothetical protein
MKHSDYTTQSVPSNPMSRNRMIAVGYRQGRESLMTYTENGSRVEVPLPDELAQAQPITLMIDKQDRVWVGTDFGRVGMRNVDGTWILFSPEDYGSYSTRQIIMDSVIAVTILKKGFWKDPKTPLTDLAELVHFI